MRTSELAAQARVNPQTLRYYERRGLLPEPERSAAEYRAYGPQAVRIVRFIKRAQDLGFAVDDIESLLHLADGGPDGCDAARHLSRTKIADIGARIADLQGMRAALDRLVATCDSPRERRDCPILARIAHDPRDWQADGADMTSIARPDQRDGLGASGCRIDPGPTTVTVEFLHTEGCPNAAECLLRVRRLLGDAGLTEPVLMRVISSPKQAERHWFLGSPTAIEL